MKILLIHHYGGIGGAGVSFLDIVDSLKDKYEITVLCPLFPNNMYEELKKRDIKLIPIEDIGILNFYNGGSREILTFSNLKQIYKIIKNLSKIKKVISCFEGELVAVNSMTLTWIGPLIKKCNKKSICFHRETFLEDNNLGTKIIKFLLKKYFDVTIFISNFDKNQVPCIDESKKYIVYDRVHKSKFIKESSKNLLTSNLSDQMTLLYLGGFSPLKGAHVIVNAMKYLKNYNVKLIFVGDTDKRSTKKISKATSIKLKHQNSYKEKIIKIVKENNLDNEIIFTNTTKYPEKLYLKCDAVVFPSTLAHQSRPIYEAGFARLPIIISDFPNTEEFVKNNYTGFTFKEGSAERLAQVILNIRNMNQDELQNIINNNYNQVLKKNDFNTLGEDLENILSKL